MDKESGGKFLKNSSNFLGFCNKKQQFFHIVGYNMEFSSALWAKMQKNDHITHADFLEHGKFFLPIFGNESLHAEKVKKN